MSMLTRVYSKSKLATVYDMQLNNLRNETIETIISPVVRNKERDTRWLCTKSRLRALDTTDKGAVKEDVGNMLKEIFHGETRRRYVVDSRKKNEKLIVTKLKTIHVEEWRKTGAYDYVKGFATFKSMLGKIEIYSNPETRDVAFETFFFGVFWVFWRFARVVLYPQKSYKPEVVRCMVLSILCNMKSNSSPATSEYVRSIPLTCTEPKVWIGGCVYVKRFLPDTRDIQNIVPSCGKNHVQTGHEILLHSLKESVVYDGLAKRLLPELVGVCKNPC